MATLKFFFRNISVFRSLSQSLSKPLEEAPKHGNPEVWEKVFYFGCIPALALCALNVYLDEEKPPPEFKPYEHLRIRKKRFPWGDGNKTLFHNPHRNCLPDGYEH